MSSQVGSSSQRKSSHPKTSGAEGRLFAIGDVHGCALELEALLRKMALREGDRVVFLGDYIDRGPDSKRVIDLILDLQSRFEVVALKGNHESLFIDFLEMPESTGAGLFILNGGSSTLASYSNGDGSFDIPKEHIDFLYELKLWHETENHVFVHAGLPERALATFSEEDEATFLWSRYPFLNSKYQWEKIVVHGHTPVDYPDLRPNRINLDTGCVYDGRLTALELNSMKFFQVDKGIKAEEPAVLMHTTYSRVAMRFTGKLPVEAGRPGDERHGFETLNYNQFGLLMRATDPTGTPEFQDGDLIDGRIKEPGGEILFEGEVVRAETRADNPVYGIRILRITNGSDGRAWIERPASMNEKKKKA